MPLLLRELRLGGGVAAEGGPEAEEQLLGRLHRVLRRGGAGARVGQVGTGMRGGRGGG